MERNFFEVLVLQRKDGTAWTNGKLVEDIQEVANILMSGKGTIDAKLRKSIDDPERFLFAAAWKKIEDYDEVDVKGLVPKLLRLLLANFNLVTAQFMFMDSSKVNFEAPIWKADAYIVKEEQKALFQKEIDTTVGITGAWYITKKMPPLPTVMPTDPLELKILDEARTTAEARLKAPTPNLGYLSRHQMREIGTEDLRSASKHMLRKYRVDNTRDSSLVKGIEDEDDLICFGDGNDKSVWIS